MFTILFLVLATIAIVFAVRLMRLCKERKTLRKKIFNTSRKHISFYDKEEYHEVTEKAWFTAIVAILFALFSLAFLINIFIILKEPAFMEYEIDKLQQENIKIESDVGTLAESCLEQKGKSDLISGDEDIITLAMTLPELYSNKLIYKQIEAYKANEEEIKDLEKEIAKNASAKRRYVDLW